MKKLDLGNSDFKSIIENDNYFVDKSLLIKEVVKSQMQVILLPRPRRFGKTLNLSMLKYFFEINESDNGKLFEKLHIWREDEIKEKQGKYPVVYLSFKDSKGKTWINTYKKIVSEIVKIYSIHDYLLEGDILKNHEKNAFNDILNKRADEVDYENSITLLTEYLYRFHNEKVVVLVDEYDTPIQASHHVFYDDAISFVRNLLSGAFKDNRFLYKGVITGVLRVSKESIFTGLNNVSAFSILDDEFSDKFGFTEMESKQILTDFNVPTDYERIKKWYDGYKIGNTVGIYNPWSILNYAVGYRNGFKTFWANTSSDELIKEQLKKKDAHYIREQLLQLINNETIEKEIDDNFVFPDLLTDKELLWTLLTFSGYLTSKNKLSRKTHELAIPNYEIKTVFQDIIVKWLNTDVNVKRSTLLNTAKYLINNEIDKFEKGFKEIIGDTFSYFDIHGEPENVYQSYVLGLLAIIGDEYIIKSNRESGMGRYDILLIPHDKSKYGIVIEIKQIARTEKEDIAAFNKRINQKINDAKNQIDKNKYYLELIENKVSKIIKLPIVFAGKEPYITQLKE